jgi:hypothetical protein
VTPKHKVALIAAPTVSRIALAGYLQNAGFDVHECDDLSLPTAFGSLVVLDRDGDRLLAEVRSWIKLSKSQRVVVVTSKPTLLRDLVALHGDRLRVLAAPAFGWDLVDALRATPPKPRGA